jgi:hypothetical protein
MSRSTIIEDLDDEQEVIEEQEEYQEYQVQGDLPISGDQKQAYSTTLMEMLKIHVRRNIKEVLLVICLVLLSHNRQLTEILKSLMKSVGGTDNKHVFLMLKGLLSGGIFLSGKVYIL